jgi:crotonobetainyl-CoA:carnitine CoA-transferase CaiB-like acyl-CoA transferase
VHLRLVALLARGRGHTRLSTRTSLARTAGWVQLPLLNDPEAAYSAGLSERGRHPLDRVYRTRDGWLQLTAVVSHWPDIWAKTDGRAPRDAGSAGRWIAREVRRRRTDDAERWATRVGFTAQPVLRARTLRRATASARPAGALIDPGLSSGRLLHLRHPAGERYTVPDALWLRPTAGRRQLAPAPSPGQHTREILTELGHSEPVIARLLSEGVAVERWFTARSYLPD